MIRRLICMECSRTHSAESLQKANRERTFYRSIIGAARTPFICDLCDHSIQQQERCWAVSSGASEKDYEPWETSFLDLLT